MYECSSKQNLAIFLHRACFSPPISIWIEDKRKFFFGKFSGLPVDLVKKYRPKSEHIVKGNMRQTFKNKISTKTLEKPTTILSEDPSEYPKNPSETPSNDPKSSRDLIPSNEKSEKWIEKPTNVLSEIEIPRTWSHQVFFSVMEFCPRYIWTK